MEEASDIGSVARMIPIRSMAYWAARREDNASPPSSLTSASGATPKSAVKSTAGRGAARSVDSLALAVIRWLMEVDRCIGCPSPSKTTISVKARFAVHSGARGSIPLAGRNGSRQAPIRTAGTLPYARAVRWLPRCHTPRLGIVRCDSRRRLSTLRGRAVRPKTWRQGRRNPSNRLL